MNIEQFSALIADQDDHCFATSNALRDHDAVRAVFDDPDQDQRPWNTWG